MSDKPENVQRCPHCGEPLFYSMCVECALRQYEEDSRKLGEITFLEATPEFVANVMLRILYAGRVKPLEWSGDDE